MSLFVLRALLEKVAAFCIIILSKFVAFHDQAIWLPFSLIMTLDNPLLCWAQQSETHSAFNIPAIVVAFLAPLLIRGASCGCSWQRMFCFFTIQGSVRLCGSEDGTSSVGRWDVSAHYLFCGLFSPPYSWWIWPDSCHTKKTELCWFFVFYMCVTLHCVCVCVCVSVLMTCFRVCLGVLYSTH